MKIFIAVIMFATQSVMACQSGVDSNRATVSDVDKTQIEARLIKRLLLLSLLQT